MKPFGLSLPKNCNSSRQSRGLKSTSAFFLWSKLGKIWCVWNVIEIIMKFLLKTAGVNGHYFNLLIVNYGPKIKMIYHQKCFLGLLLYSKYDSKSFICGGLWTIFAKRLHHKCVAFSEIQPLLKDTHFVVLLIFQYMQLSIFGNCLLNNDLNSWSITLLAAGVTFLKSTMETPE